ncbi:aminoacyl-tRNA hydrolase [bacterium]|nr:aminoacyl-tRNA hydrolase [bacterium]
MKIVVGLGNPGSKYDGTRHNVGFEALWELSHRWQAPKPKGKFQGEITEINIAAENVLLVWPQTYMNLSGACVAPLQKFYQVSSQDLVVLCDDLNLPLGQLRLRGGGSSGGQKGLQSILQAVGTNDVPRLRIGVDRPPAGVDAASFVLAKFRSAEREVMDRAVRSAADGVELWLWSGLEAAMNVVNSVKAGDVASD